MTARVLPGVMLLDGLGGRRMPWPASFGLAACGAVLVFPYSHFGGTSPGGLVFLGLLLKEIFVGATFAVGASSVFWCLKMAGQVMDGMRGGARSQTVIMMDGSKGSPLALLYSLLACVVFLELGGAQGLLRGLVNSFDLVPIQSAPSGEIVNLALTWVVGIFKIAIETAVWVAWPLMASMIFVDIVLGAMCRSASQLPVYFIGLPLKSSVGVLMAGLILKQVAPLVSQLLGSVVGA